VEEKGSQGARKRPEGRVCEPGEAGRCGEVVPWGGPVNGTGTAMAHGTPKANSVRVFHKERINRSGLVWSDTAGSWPGFNYPDDEA